MAKAKTVPARQGSLGGLSFKCPGCGTEHTVLVGVGGSGARWLWNGNLDRPTLSPSVLVRVDFDGGKLAKICHSFVIDGQIQFLNDCTHKLAGQTVPMLDVD